MPLAMLEPRNLLQAYASGAFPMADREGVIRFYTADPARHHPAVAARRIPRSRDLASDHPQRQV